MQKINLVLADIDGTIVLPGSNSATSVVLEAVKEARDRGVMFAAVTGRSFEMSSDLLNSLKFGGVSIFDGGSSIVDILSEQVLWSRSVPADIARRVIEVLLPHASGLGLNGRAFNPMDFKASQILEPAQNIWAAVPAVAAEELIKELRLLPGIAVHGNAGPEGDFTLTGIQVTDSKADKKHAVDELLKILKADKRHTLAIGDGDNDLPLFEAAHIKVAMGNASDMLRANADFVVASVEEDGFAEAIQKFTV